ACSYDGATAALKLYIDQDLAVSGTGTAALQWDTNPFIVGGATDNGSINSEFRGDIDEVLIWGTVRSIDQVAVDMHTCSPASLAGLAGYWSFDEGSGQVAADATTNRNTLQLGSAVTPDGSDPAWLTSTVPF
ncbi:MAG TPA: LamG-like jellyroll fold domain-containing protein, partial [Polyangia bacterium]